MFIAQLSAHATKYPFKLALVSEKYTIKYNDLYDLVNKLSHYLMGAGVRRGSHVAICISDEIHHLLATLALLAINTRQVTLPSFESNKIKDQICTNSDTEFLLAEDCVFDNATLKKIEWPDLDKIREMIAYERAIPSDNGLSTILLNTTGTTGSSNLIPFKENQLIEQSLQFKDYQNENLLRLAPVEFNTSKRHRLYSIWNGGTNTFRPVPHSLNSVISALAKFNVTCLDISKMHISELIALNQPNFFRGIKIRPGGSDVSFEIREEFMRKVSPYLYVRYATTETGGVSIAGPNEHISDGNCGKAMDNVSIEIVDPETHLTLPQGVLGEVRIKSPGMATHYLSNEKQTALRFSGGWFYPGDMGCLNKEGKIVIKGRKDDMINLNGINIFPMEIEKALEAFPFISESAAFGITSKIHGQIPVAAIVIKECEKFDIDFLKKSLQEILGIRRPREIYITNKIPRNSQGKILRNELHKMFNGSK